MISSRSFLLLAFVASLSGISANPNSICYSYGVDFVDEGSYFINSLSPDPFTCVSYFRGCNEDVADVLFVDPGDIEYLCTQIPTTPENEFKMSTCPIKKNQMESGHWLLLVLGNNDDGQPFAWQRDLYLTVGPQATSTYTPTVTFSITTTPIVTQTMTTTSTDIITTGPLSTITVPSGTAKRTKTVTPPPTTTTSTKTMTKTSVTLTKNFAVTTKTVTATCTAPGRPGRPDKPCRHSPTLLHPAALVTPTTIPPLHRFVRKSDRVVDYEWARARVEVAKARRDAKAQEAAASHERRAADVPTTTVTYDIPVNTTTTVTAQTTTTTESVLITTTSTSTLPPVTVLSGLLTQTITLPTPTKTKVKFTSVATTKTVSFGATFTRTKTVTPTASVTACKRQGGHFLS
ncbi:Nn.00g020720.m01.CDS01 [Neocucurbitaria sp. VM-36]